VWVIGNLISKNIRRIFLENIQFILDVVYKVLIKLLKEEKMVWEAEHNFFQQLQFKFRFKNLTI